MTNLRWLGLAATQVRDLSPLGGLTSLHVLILHKTEVSDLTPIHGLTNLQKLGISETNVTDQEVAQLQKALPSCDIVP